MSNSRPKRDRRPPQRYEPEEVPLDDYDEEEVSDIENSGETRTQQKRWRGEFDGFDEEEDLNEPDEYDVNDGFVVEDGQGESYNDSYESGEEEEFDDEEEEDYEDSEPEYEDSYEPDVVEREPVAEYKVVGDITHSEEESDDDRY